VLGTHVKETVVKILLNAGVDVNAQGGFFDDGTADSIIGEP
jgi:hypothetical protein